MNTLEAIHQRRSVKHYDPAHRMTEGEITSLMEHAILSPTSFNMQNWRFVVVQDTEIRQQLREAAWNQAQVTDASITIVLCAYLNSHRNPERYWKDAPEEVRNMMAPMTTGFYEDNAQLQRDEAMRSCGIAGQTIMLTAKEMGYGSCPMIGFDPQKVAEIINLPEDHVISMMITVGKAADPARGRGGQLPLSEVVVSDQF